MEQLTKEGVYTGGSVAYGYQICKLGRTNKRGYEVHDILVEPQEAQVVKEIFRLYSAGIMGTYRIASYLTKQGIPNRNGKAWNSATILNMIKNSTYIGILKFGGVTSDCFPHLCIVDDASYKQAQQKAFENKDIRPRGIRSKLRVTVLAADTIYCMRCGKRMIVRESTKTRMNKKGELKTYYRVRYFCRNRTNCDGQKLYSVDRVDAGLRTEIDRVLSDINFPHVPECGTIDNKISEQKQGLLREQSALADLENEVLAVIRGTSAFGTVILSELIYKTQRNITEIKTKIEHTQEERRNQHIQRNRIAELHKLIRNGEQGTFSLLPLLQQQNIFDELVKKIEIDTDYQYRIEWTFGGVSSGNFESIREPSSK